MSRLHTSFVLGFHGCDKQLGVDAVCGRVSLIPGKSTFDWIGEGIYFWESDPIRAFEWAQQKQTRGACNAPFVIGAVIDLGNCLDLLARENVELLRVAYDSFKTVREKAGLPMPVNKRAPKDQSPDLVMRFLDCAVLNHLHSIVTGSGLEPFDSVRAVFSEGKPVFTGSNISDRSHAQIAVRNPKCIKGLFLPIDAGGLPTEAVSMSNAGESLA